MAVIALLPGARAAAQQSASQITVGAAPLLSGFAREERSASTSHAAAGAITSILRNRPQYPQARVDSLLAGLEDLALNADDRLVRMAAAARLPAAGSRDVTQPLPGMVARVRRVYQASRDSMVKTTLLAELPSVSERAAGIALLRELAVRSKREESFQGEVHAAIRSLLRMGDDGRNAVRELHDRKLIRHPEEAARVEELVRAGGGLDHGPGHP